jgi:hypothetical protein
MSAKQDKIPISFDDLEFIEPSETDKVTLDLNKIKNDLHKYSVQKLCDMIICNRYFNLNNEITVMCMEELSRRRDAGDIFDFERYIEENSKELPELDFTMPDLRTMMSSIIARRITIK